MDLYNQIKNISPEAKAAADKFMQGLSKEYTADNPAPDYVIQKGLETIIGKFSNSTGTKYEHAIGLAGLLASVAAISSGAYALGLVGVFATMASYFYKPAPKAKIA